MAGHGGGLTPGDPLGGGPPERPAQAGQHYGDRPMPPGAFAPRPERPAPPSRDELAEWWRRAVATIVDGVIVGGLALAILAALGAGFFADDQEIGPVELVVGALLWVLFFVALSLLYAPLIMARTNGQTPGKMLTSCRVVRADGKRCTFWWAALREVLVKGALVGVASAITGGIAYLVDVLWPLVDGQNRALHDYVVDSRVVRS